MPFLELLAALIIVPIAVAILIGLSAVYAGIAVFIAGFVILTGWIPIMMCATDFMFNIGSGFVGKWAEYSLYGYTAISACLLGVMIIRPDPDGLPPAWKFIAGFYKVRETKLATATNLNVSEYGKIPAVPPTAIGKRMAKSVADHGTAKLNERAVKRNKETNDYLDAMRRRAEAAEEAAKAEAAKAATAEWKAKHDQS